MDDTTPDICDEHFADIKILEPLFTEFGGREKFSGEVVTIKCFEDNSLVKQQLANDGRGKVLVVDGGGSLRCALLGDMLGDMAAQNGWQGVGSQLYEVFQPPPTPKRFGVPLLGR